MGDVAAIYRDICEMLWVQGDRDGAQACSSRAATSRSTGDLRLQSWTLRALATIASDDAATDEVLSEYREVTALAEQGSDPGGGVGRCTTADTLRIRGEPRRSKSCGQAQNEAAAVSASYNLP